jgi:hypothetical protein
MSMRSDFEHYFVTHPNEKVYLKDIHHLIYDGDVTDVQASMRAVQQVASLVIRKDVLPGLEVVHRGQCWIYKPNNKGSDPTFSLVAEGTVEIVLRDSKGKFWIARPVEVR